MATLENRVLLDAEKGMQYRDCMPNISMSLHGVAGTGKDILSTSPSRATGVLSAMPRIEWPLRWLSPLRLLDWSPSTAGANMFRLSASSIAPH